MNRNEIKEVTELIEKKLTIEQADLIHDAVEIWYSEDSRLGYKLLHCWAEKIGLIDCSYLIEWHFS